MKFRAIKIAISLVCAAFAAVHLLYPAINIDAVALGLIAIGILPWLHPLIKSLELPGGLKIELQDIKAVTDKISEGIGARPLALPTEMEGTDDLLSFIGKVAEQDPNLAIVALRIEVEKLLVEIAEANGIDVEKRGAGTLLRELSRREVIPQDVASGLSEFIALGNQAAHGATVSMDAAAWALTQAPELLGILSSFRS